MNNNNNHSRIPEYFATVFLSIVVVFFVCFAIELDLLYKVEERVYREAFSMASLARFSSIEALQKQLLAEPNNYMIHIKLAHIHEEYGEFKKANKCYEKALKLSNNSNFTLYNYSLFLARQRLYTLSATYAEQLISHSKKVIEYKAKIYETMADHMQADSEFLAATKAYQVAYKYAKSLNKKRFYDDISKKYSLSCIELADLYVKDKRIEDAIMNLKNSIKIYETDAAKYKLALIYKDANPQEAYSLLLDVFKKNPFMVNPYILNEVLDKLIKTAKANNDVALVDFYTMKKNRFIKQLNEEYIFHNDLSIDNIHIIAKKKNVFSKKQYFLIFNLKNNTKSVIDNLYMEFVILGADKKHEIRKQIISPQNSLNYYEELKDIEIILPSTFGVNNLLRQNGIILKCLAKKKKIAPWVLLKVVSLDI